MFTRLLKLFPIDTHRSSLEEDSQKPAQEAEEAKEAKEAKEEKKKLTTLYTLSYT